MKTILDLPRELILSICDYDEIRTQELQTLRQTHSTFTNLLSAKTFSTITFIIPINIQVEENPNVVYHHQYYIPQHIPLSIRHHFKTLKVLENLSPASKKEKQKLKDATPSIFHLDQLIVSLPQLQLVILKATASKWMDKEERVQGFLSQLNNIDSNRDIKFDITLHGVRDEETILQNLTLNGLHSLMLNSGSSIDSHQRAVSRGTELATILQVGPHFKRLSLSYNGGGPSIAVMLNELSAQSNISLEALEISTMCLYHAKAPGLSSQICGGRPHIPPSNLAKLPHLTHLSIKTTHENCFIEPLFTALTSNNQRMRHLEANAMSPGLLSYLSLPSLGHTLKTLHLENIFWKEDTVDDTYYATTFWNTVMPNLAPSLQNLTLFLLPRMFFTPRGDENRDFAIHIWSFTYPPTHIHRPQLRSLATFAELDLTTTITHQPSPEIAKTSRFILDDLIQTFSECPQLKSLHIILSIRFPTNTTSTTATTTTKTHTNTNTPATLAEIYAEAVLSGIQHSREFHGIVKSHAEMYIYVAIHGGGGAFRSVRKAGNYWFGGCDGRWYRRQVRQNGNDFPDIYRHKWQMFHAGSFM